MTTASVGQTRLMALHGSAQTRSCPLAKTKGPGRMPQAFDGRVGAGGGALQGVISSRPSDITTWGMRPSTSLGMVMAASMARRTAASHRLATGARHALGKHGAVTDPPLTTTVTVGRRRCCRCTLIRGLDAGAPCHHSRHWAPAFWAAVPEPATPLPWPVWPISFSSRFKRSSS